MQHARQASACPSLSMHRPVQDRKAVMAETPVWVSRFYMVAGPQ